MARSAHHIHLFFVGALFTFIAGCASVDAVPGSPDTAQPAEEIALVGVIGGSLAEPTLDDTFLNLMDAEITLDDEPADARAVLPGAVLEGVAEKKNGRFKVRRLALESQLRGPVEAVEAAGEAGTLNVLGVQVVLDDYTYLFERGEGGVAPVALSDLAPSDYVQVYGLPQAGERLEATLIVRTNEHDHVWLRVAVRALDEAAQTFQYGLLTHRVDYSSASVQGEVAEGETVAVKGVLEGSVVVAEQLRTKRNRDNEKEKEKPERPASSMHLSGKVTELDSLAQTFIVIGLEVDYSGAQVQGDLAEGVWIKLQGTAQDNVVRAEKIMVKQRPKRAK